MQWEIRGMAEANPRISDTLPRRGRVNEVCREWIVHEDEALAYQLQKQEVEQHYGGNKERNARVREDFPKAKEEQEREIMEAAEKHRQMVRKQEQLDSMYAYHVAERLERDEHERQRRIQQQDMEVARKMQAYEVTYNTHQSANGHPHHHERQSNVKMLSTNVPDVNRVGLPLVQNANFEPVSRHQPNLPLTRSLRELRLSNESCVPSVSPSSSSLSFPPPPPPDVDAPPPSASPSKLLTTFRDRSNRTRTPAPVAPLPDDLNGISRNVSYEEDVDRRVQEEKDAELARMLQQQEEEIFSEEVDRDRMIAIEAQDKELAKLLYEKEKAKVRRAKERARQRALLKRQQQQQQQLQDNAHARDDGDDDEDRTVDDSASCLSSVHGGVEPPVEGGVCRFSGPERQTGDRDDEAASELEPERHCLQPGNSFHTSTLAGGRTLAPPLMNVAMHIDPTYLSQQSSSMPNSLIFQEGETTAPPYMPIQGQRRTTPLPEKKPKKPKSKDGCKQQ